MPFLIRRFDKRVTTEEHVTGLQNCGVFDAAELKANRSPQCGAADADITGGVIGSGPL